MLGAESDLDHLDQRACVTTWTSRPTNRVTRPTIGHEHRSVTRRASLPERLRRLDLVGASSVDLVIAAESKSRACSVIAASNELSHSMDEPGASLPERVRWIW